ncbi:hypothetical protein PILCRDRAFT_12124 [Piloderma croceum F 1598]|uniref:Protein kinase domain-containing protein n=1 Tax=Piloderma croceum (strain F 1598) TaxID=765440 RepID=A0A0C3ATP7_PILCF|nr:hypothetical protein PILCRDRAFT_12124 [Piloderma croceum F 1598]
MPLSAATMIKNNILIDDNGMALLVDFGLSNVTAGAFGSYITSSIGGSVRWAGAIPFIARLPHFYGDNLRRHIFLRQRDIADIVRKGTLSSPENLEETPRSCLRCPPPVP